jgi:hypothetical protein
MRKLAMTICGAAFASASVIAQTLDSTGSFNDFRTQYPELNQSTDSASSNPQFQNQQSPIIQPQYQTQPSIQPAPQPQSQPTLKLQPLETNPQIPSQTQPMDLNSPAQQDQIEQPVQPAAPTPAGPADNSTQRPG